MASSTTTHQPSTAPQSPPQHSNTSTSRPSSTSDALSSSPVEMRTLPSSSTTPPPANNTAQSPDTPITTQIAATNPHIDAMEPSEAASPASPTAAKPAPPTDLSRSETEAIGPSTDTPALDPDNSNGPTLVIMLLLTTGARHPYKIDEKYLKKRNVTVEAMDPYNISVYTLKELIWRDWREGLTQVPPFLPVACAMHAKCRMTFTMSAAFAICGNISTPSHEWETRPTSPSSIRLIHFGRMLDDKSPLKECRFQTDTPNVVHMTVKPQEVVDDEENAKSGKGPSRRDGEDEPTAGCRCTIL
ncbi:predicted protein [Plenodomus lingam JN3]|uniref:Predicted protein n=1 Tax=Leptosphaeria maculans (strain JN3 / isolate v23.1.3 / race Av1-4-5-6-7-8) TaxID=985895 RepID=E4ZN08_LEPMJ|nr:predicted protein [Plenodomus lingam JN3]CBX92611.1 predicted protein [Plenodomus lingam JN3]